MINLNRKEFVSIAKASFRKWLSQNSPIRAAALAFFIILPLPSLLLIIVAVFAQFFGEAQALENLLQQITALAGPAVAELVRELLESARTPFTSTLASITSVGFTLGGAVGAFAVLHDTLNSIWEVPSPQRESLKSSLAHKVFPFLVVSALGVIVVVWTGIATVLFHYVNLLLEPFLGGLTPIFLAVGHIILSFSLAALLFAIAYKRLPDTRVEWGDVTLAAILTALVFTITNSVFGFYIQTFPITSVIGAAGSLMILLLWIFLINQYILFGAAFSQTYAAMKGSRAKTSGEKPKTTQVTVEPVSTRKALMLFSEELIAGLKELPTDVEVDVKFKLARDKEKAADKDKK